MITENMKCIVYLSKSSPKMKLPETIYLCPVRHFNYFNLS